MTDGPVIVSSNRFDDIKPYCGRIYDTEPEKWSSVLPWEFPQNASRADEEAFLRQYFTDSEIHSRGGADGAGLGYKFLKQVWYSIALWNLEHKIPAIAEEWIRHNESIVNDPAMLEHVCKEDATLATFAFGEKQERMYGEKVLGWVIKFIQYRVRYRDGEPPTQQQSEKATEVVAKPAEQTVDGDAGTPKATGGVVEPVQQAPEVDGPMQTTDNAIAKPAQPSLDDASLPNIASSEAAKRPEASNSAELTKATPFFRPEIAYKPPNSAQFERFPDLARTESYPVATDKQFTGEPAFAHQQPTQSQNAGHAPTQQFAQPQNAGMPLMGDAGYGPPSQSVQPQTAAYQYPGDTGYAPQKQRPRGNSNGKRYNNNNRLSNPRSHYQQHPYYQSQSPYQGPAPTLNMASPSIGSVPPMHPMNNQQQMRMPPHMQGHVPPPPPGVFQHGMPPYQQQPQYGQPMYATPQDMPIPPNAYGPGPQPNPYYNSYSKNDRTNDRYGYENRNFSDNRKFSESRNFNEPAPFSRAEDSMFNQQQSGRGGRGRRDSNASRGSKRGGYKSGRGRGSGGSMSFTDGRPFKDAFGSNGQFSNDARRSSEEYGNAPPPSETYSHHRDRGSSFTNENWRDMNNRSQRQQHQIAFSERVFSGSGLSSAGMTAGIDSTTPMDPNDFRRQSFQNTGRRMSIAPGPSPFHQQPFPPRVPVAKGIVHDTNDPTAQANPERFLDKTHIGAECSHVKKLVMFGVPAEANDNYIQNIFSKIGRPVIHYRCPDKRNDDVHVVYLVFDSHFTAKRALELNGSTEYWKQSLNVQVPKEYWDPHHRSYPGWGTLDYSQQQQRGRIGYPPLSMPQFESAPVEARDAPRVIQKQELTSGDSTPTAKKPKDSNSEEGGKAEKETEHMSGDTTPTAVSGTSTPRRSGKKNKNKGKKKQQQPDPRAEALTAALARHEKVESKEVDPDADAKSDASTGTVIREQKLKEGHTKEGSVQEGHEKEDAKSAEPTQPPPLTSEIATEAEHKASVQSDDAQTKSEVTFSPETSMTEQFPKVNMPQAEPKKADAVTVVQQPFVQQPFLGTEKAEEKAAGEQASAVAVEMGEAVNAEDKPVTVEPMKAEDSAQVSPQKSEDDQADDSFHTANGSPHGSDDGRKKADRGSGDTDTTESSKASTAILTPATPTSAETPSKVADKVAEPATEEQQKGTEQTEQTETRTESRTKPSPSPSTKAPKKAPVPKLAMVRIPEPSSAANEKGPTFATETQRSASALSVPPTPAFQTAPSTPAQAIEAEKDEGEKDEPEPEVAEHPQLQPPKKAEKVEKSKGPAQTESLSLFSKKQQPKPKKKQPVKGKKGAGKGSGDGRSFSDVPSDATVSRVVSATPSTVAEETVGDSEDVILGEKSNDSMPPPPPVGGQLPAETTKKIVAGTEITDTKPPTSPPSQPSRSDSKPRSMLGYVSNLFSGQASRSSTPALKAGEPSYQPIATDGKAESITSSDDTAANTAPQRVYPVTPGKEEAEREPGTGAPVAQMVAPADSSGLSGRFEQPFRSSSDVHDGAGCRDSGDSGGDLDASGGDGVGLGISTAALDASNEASVDQEVRPKKKKKRAGRKKKDEVAGKPQESQDGGPTPEGTVESDATTKPFAFEFKANSQPLPSNAVSHKPSSSQVSISDITSEASSHTAGRSSREPTPTSTRASTTESPAKMIQKKLAQGTPHIVGAPPLRRKTRRINSTAKASAESTSSSLEKAESDNEMEVSNPLDNILGKIAHQNKQQQAQQPPMLYLYVGPGKRSEEKEWKEEQWDGVEQRVQEGAGRRLSEKENERPGETGRKGG